MAASKSLTVSGSSLQVALAAAVASIALCQALVNLASHFMSASLYFMVSPVVASLASAFCRHREYLPAALFFAAWHCWMGVPAALATFAAATTAAASVKIVVWS